MALPIGLEYTAVTIPNGTAVTAAIPMGAKTLCGIYMPAAWTTAGLSFQASPDGGTTFVDMHTSSAELTYTAVASIYIALDPTLWRGVNEIIIRSGASGSPVNQGADRVLTLATRPLM